MHGALHKLSEIKLLVSEYVEEECIIVGPKTCAKLQQWFGAASAKELAAQPITGDNTPPPATLEEEITPKWCTDCKHNIDCLRHSSRGLCNSFEPA